MPAITIGMPVYNGGRFLEEALRSILSQTCSDFELIVSDNASTDDTVAIAQRLAAGDARVTVKRNPVNVGAAPNYNGLVEIARGRFFKWAAHDDILHPEYLQACLRGLEAHPEAVLCYPTTVMIDEAGNPTEEDPYDPADVTGPAPHNRFRRYMDGAWPRCGCNAVFGLIRTDALRATRMIGAYASSDKILLGELALLGAFRQLPERLFFRREHRGSSVRANPDFHARTLWFDTAATGAAEFVRWKWVGEYAKGVRHARLGVTEEARCLWELCRFIQREWPRLRAELKRPVRKTLTRMGLRPDGRS